MKVNYLLAPLSSHLLSGGKLTAVVILPSSGKTSFGALMKTTQDVRGFFGRHYPSAFGREGPSVEVAKDFHERRWEVWDCTFVVKRGP